MKANRRAIRKAKFSGRKQSIRGWIGLVIGVLSLILLGASLSIAIAAAGTASMYVGSLGVLSAIFAIVGFIVSFMSIFEEDVYKVVPILATVVGAVSILSVVGIYIMGMIR